MIRESDCNNDFFLWRNVKIIKIQLVMLQNVFCFFFVPVFFRKQTFPVYKVLQYFIKLLLEHAYIEKYRNIGINSKTANWVTIANYFESAIKQKWEIWGTCVDLVNNNNYTIINLPQITNLMEVANLNNLVK